MNIAVALNSILGSLLLQFLIFADYIRKYTTDVFQRSIFLKLLVFSFVAALFDFLYILLHGYSPPWVFPFLTIIIDIYFVTQVAAYCYIFIFLDYAAFKDSLRTKRLSNLIWAVIIVHIAILLANTFSGFYFFISISDNRYHFGKFYIIRLVISMIPAALGVFDIIYSLALHRKSKYTKATVLLVSLFILFVGVSATVDILFATTSFVWPAFTSMLLYTYFFIIRQDARIDPLTKIGNRFALDEFIDKLSHQNTKESWAFAMIDMDHFKGINDKLGHAAGDMALRDMANIITKCLAGSDFAARYGGDEFIIATKSDPSMLLHRLQQAVREFNDEQKRDYQIQMSFGYDIFTTGGHQILQDLLGHIDSLMYAQKKYKLNRRGKISVITPFLAHKNKAEQDGL